MMVIYFKSDGKNRLQGFKARFTILLSGEYKHLWTFAYENGYREDYLAVFT